MSAAIALTWVVVPLSAQGRLEELEVLLDQSGSRIEEFWSQYARVTSIEDVLQSRLNPEGRVLAETRGSYDYLMVMQLTGRKPRFEESRIERGEDTRSTEGPLLVTSGFSTLLLILHPYFQPGFEFSLVPDPETPEGLRRIDFQPIPGQRSPSVLRLEGRNYPIHWKGSAWIDPDTGMVTRIETGLGESMEDLGLNSLSARTEYTRVPLGVSELEYWLPAATTIEARSEHQYWKNTHRFTNYQLFSVESDLDILEPAEGDQ